MKRRDLLKLAGAVSLVGCATTAPAKARVVVVGGGFGGATAAKYIRMWDPKIDVVLVEREASFVSCPISNLVLGDIAYERLVVSPGIDFTFGDVQGYEQAMQSGRVLHAWKAGPQTVALRRQLEQMRDGGVYVLSIPVQPYRCPPGPYERASVVAAYFKQAKPRSKVLILDANPDVTSKAGLFKRAWSDLYPGIIEYRGNSRAVAVDGNSMTVRLEVEDVKGDVLNVVPPHRAADVAARAGLITTNNRWCASPRR